MQPIGLIHSGEKKVDFMETAELKDSIIKIAFNTNKLNDCTPYYKQGFVYSYKISAIIVKLHLLMDFGRKP
jgi:hypothetical protein